MYSVSQSTSFEASHYIRVDDTPDHYKHIHGHSFVVTAECTAGDVNEHGWVVDLGHLENSLKAVVSQLDHKILNDIDGLEKPTFENIMKWIFDHLKQEHNITASKITIARPTLGQSGSYAP